MRFPGATIRAVFLLLVTGGSTLAAEYDLLIQNAWIADGTGAPLVRGSIAVKAGRISEVGAVAGSAAVTIDAEGRIAAPGFIDVHTHSERIPKLPAAENFVRMGVTTIVTGNCGSSRTAGGRGGDWGDWGEGEMGGSRRYRQGRCFLLIVSSWRSSESPQSPQSPSPTMRITRHSELEVFKRSYEVAMKLFRHSKTFPKEETYSLTDQVRRSSRSVAANITEAWRKRRYEAAFISKLSDAETEAAETQTWIRFARSCRYLTLADAKALHAEYEEIIAMLVAMIARPEHWRL